MLVAGKSGWVFRYSKKFHNIGIWNTCFCPSMLAKLFPAQYSLTVQNRDPKYHPFCYILMNKKQGTFTILIVIDFEITFPYCSG